MPSLSTILLTGSPPTGGSSSLPASASSQSMAGITVPNTGLRGASTALSGGGNSGSSGHLIVLPPTRYQAASQLSSSLFHSVAKTTSTATTTPTAITLRASSLSSAADHGDSSLTATQDENLVDCDELLLAEAAAGSTLPKSFTFFNSSSLLSSYSSASSHESEVFALPLLFTFILFDFVYDFACFLLAQHCFSFLTISLFSSRQPNLNILTDGNTLANFSDDEDDPREPSPSKKLKKSNSFNGSSGKVAEPKSSLNAPPSMSSNNSLEYISNIIHNSVQSNSASHGNGTPNSVTVNDASNGATANHLSALKNSLTNGPLSCSSICGNSALSRDELREQIEQFSKVEIRACLQKIFHEKYALYILVLYGNFSLIMHFYYRSQQKPDRSLPGDKQTRQTCAQR